MAKTSKSPKRILQVAHQLGKQRLRLYSHKFSPKKFTLPQLFACLVLKEFMRLDYRKLSALLEDAPSLAATIDLKQVPHFSTFQKAAARLLVSRRVQLLLNETIQAATKHRVMRKNVTLAAISMARALNRGTSARTLSDDVIEPVKMAITPRPTRDFPRPTFSATVTIT